LSLHFSTTLENACRNGSRIPRVLNVNASQSFAIQRHFLGGGRWQCLPLIFDNSSSKQQIQYTKSERERIPCRHMDSNSCYSGCSRLPDCADSTLLVRVTCNHLLNHFARIYWQDVYYRIHFQGCFALSICALE
jgi:hypothetical protein